MNRKAELENLYRKLRDLRTRPTEEQTAIAIQNIWQEEFINLAIEPRNINLDYEQGNSSEEANEIKKAQGIVIHQYIKDIANYLCDNVRQRTGLEIKISDNDVKWDSGNDEWIIELRTKGKRETVKIPHERMYTLDEETHKRAYDLIRGGYGKLLSK